MYIPTRLEEGTEYPESLQAARSMKLPGFAENLRAAEGMVKFSPELATPVQNSQLRIAEIFDKPNGYSVALYFIGGVGADVATLEDVRVFELPPDFVPVDWI